MRKRILAGSAALLILNICMTGTGQARENDLKKWEESILRQRSDKDDYFKNSPVSPMAGILRETIEPGQSIHVILEKGGIRISREPADAPECAIFNKDGEWAARDRSGRETPLKSAGEQRTVGRFTLVFYPSDAAFTLQVFDPERTMRKEFRHLLYYPPDPRFRVTAKLERYESKKERTVKTSRDLEKTLIEYGKVTFSMDGKSLSLTAFKFTSDPEDPNYKYLFLPFYDRTNLSETYEAGRFLDVVEPAGDVLLIDFNECYNPLCNYSDVYNCTLPPFENELDIDIEAGEKTYPH